MTDQTAATHKKPAMRGIRDGVPDTIMSPMIAYLATLIDEGRYEPDVPLRHYQYSAQLAKAAIDTCAEKMTFYHQSSLRFSADGTRIIKARVHPRRINRQHTW